MPAPIFLSIYAAYPLILIFFTPVNLILAGYAWTRRRETPGALLIALYMLGAGLASFGYGMELLSPSLNWKMLWVGLRYLGNTGLMAGVILLLSLWFTGHTSWLRPRKALLLFILPVFSLAGFFTNPWHHLHYTAMSLDASGPLVMLVKTNGPLYNFMISFTFAYLLLAVWLGAWAVFSMPRAYFGQALGIFLGCTLPTGFTLAYLLGWRPLGALNLTPLSYVASSFIFGWAILRLKLFEVSPVTLSLLFDRIPTGVIVLDALGRVASLNRSAQAALGRPLAQISGRTAAAACVHWPALQRWMEAQVAGEPTGQPMVIPHFDSDRQYALEMTSLQDGNQMVLLTDVTLREAAEQAMREQQSVLAALAEREKLGRDLHDGVGQLTGFVSVQSQAARQYLRNGQTELVDATLARLQEAARESHADVRNFILDLQDGSPDGPTAEAAPLDFYADLERYIAHFNAMYGMDARLDLPPLTGRPALPPDVALQVLRIVQEALSNVRKHAGVQQARLSMQANGAELLVMVDDEGAGFSPEGAARPGHLGQAIMVERADQIGARLEVLSAPGRGTHVKMILPLARPEAPVPASLSHLRVLLADDQELFRTGLRNLLAARGLQVVAEASNGKQALELARQARPGLVLMDLDMPVMDGIEATRLLRAEFPEIQVVVLTVAANRETLLKALQAGAAGYLLKDMQAAELFAMLEALARGEKPISPALAGRALAEFAGAAGPELEAAGLTNRQLEILRLAAKNLTNAQIGLRLDLTEAAVKYHFHQIFERLQVQSREQALSLAARRGWIDRRQS